MKRPFRLNSNYRGINRRWFVLLFTPIFVFSVLVFNAGGPSKDDLHLPLKIITAFFYIPLAWLRLENIGKSSWYSILVLIPLVNFFLVMYCVFAKEEAEEGNNVVNSEGSANSTEMGEQVLLAKSDGSGG